MAASHKRRLFLPLALIALSISTSSCVKDWICECTITDNSTGNQFIQNNELDQLTKSDAEIECSDSEYVSDTFTAECRLQ